MDLSSITSERWDAGRSLARAEFNTDRERVFANLDYDEVLKREEIRTLIRDPRGKVWVHRVNSIGKLQQCGSQYSGVELDLVFDRNHGDPFFDVNHPPAESIGLRLDEFLASKAEPRALKYWLDLKNLSGNNKQHVLARLRWLMERHGLEREHLIIKSSEYAALRSLSDAGLRTSYYLPTYESGTLSHAEEVELAIRLAERTRQSGAWAISCSGVMLDFAKAQLLPCLDGIRLLTWFPGLRLDDWIEAALIQRIVRDQSVDIVLVGYRTPYDR